MTVRDLESTRAFYGGVLGCREGRSAETWVDFEWAGHQLSFHLGETTADRVSESRVDGLAVPFPHFGLVLPRAEFDATVENLRAANARFDRTPTDRYEEGPGAQRTCFVRDPSGNAIELKTFSDPSELFES